LVKTLYSKSWRFYAAIFSPFFRFYSAGGHGGFGDLPVHGKSRTSGRYQNGGFSYDGKAMTPLADYKKPKRFVADKLMLYSPRGLLLYLLPLALIPATIIALVKGNFLGIIVNASGLALYVFAAMSLRKGLQAERALAQNPISRASKWPLKKLAAIITALATGLIAWLGAQQTLPVALLFAGGAFLGMYLSYGFDLRQEKKVADAQGYSGEEILRMLEESSQVIRSIEQANKKIRNTELNRRIDTICAIADRILAEIEADPRDIRRARKFLNVYLDGAKQVTEGYAQTHQQNQSGQLEQNFRNVLETIESVFQEQHQKLLEDDVFDLDVKIEVLTTQLKREGIL
jgi:5-bromo-4-chloroindolyl phosphate hydrolysis protein